MIDIKVLGPGCKNCLMLETLCKEVITENGVEASIEKVTDYKEIKSYGILSTPGLVINGKVVLAGKLPTKSTLTHWLTNILPCKEDNNPSPKEKSKSLLIEVHYFEGCPNSEKMINLVREATNRISADFDYKEILIDSPAKARQLKFRGSPTVLVNGIDLEGLPEPEEGNLACRYYQNGLPTVNGILDFIERQITKE